MWYVYDDIDEFFFVFDGWFDIVLCDVDGSECMVIFGIGDVFVVFKGIEYRLLLLGGVVLMFELFGIVSIGDCYYGDIFDYVDSIMGKELV